MRSPSAFQVLGGVSLAMAPDIAETTLIPRAAAWPGRKRARLQISRASRSARTHPERSARTMAKQAKAMREMTGLTICL